MEKVYLVTGASGFLGSAIVRLLLRRNDGEVRVLLLPGDDARALKGLDVSRFEGDVADRSSLAPFFSGLEGRQSYVYHCAAIVSILSKNDGRLYKVNVAGTQNVIEECLIHHSRLLYVNSVHAIPESKKGTRMAEIDHFDPRLVVGDYAKSKAMAAELFLSACLERGLDGVMVHPSGIIGPGDFGHSHLNELIVAYGNGKLPCAVRGGYDFVDVRDVADGAVSASFVAKPGSAYILSNRHASIKEILDDASEALGKRKMALFLPISVAKAVAPFTEGYCRVRKKTPLFTRYSLYTLKANSLFSHEKASEELGFLPRPLSETIRDMVWFLLKEGKIVMPRRKKLSFR